MKCTIRYIHARCREAEPMHPAALRWNCTSECPRDVPSLIALSSGSFRPRALYAGRFRRFVFPHTTPHSTPASVISPRSVRQVASGQEGVAVLLRKRRPLIPVPQRGREAGRFVRGIVGIGRCRRVGVVVVLSVGRVPELLDFLTLFSTRRSLGVSENSWTP